MCHYHIFQQNITLHSIFRFYRYKPRQRLRHLNQSMHRSFTAMRNYARYYLYRSIIQQWKRMKRIHRHRRQHRKNLVFKIVVKFQLLLRRQIQHLLNLYTLGTQRRKKLFTQKTVLLILQPPDLFINLFQQNRRTLSRRIRRVLPRIQQMTQSGYANHEKLIQITAEYRYEFQPLKQRTRPLKSSQEISRGRNIFVSIKLPLMQKFF